MIWFLIVFVIILCFGFVLLFGAPYLPTHSLQAKIALDMLDLNKSDNFYELGCGDGKVLIMASSKCDKAVGFELNPILYIIAKIRTAKYKNVSVKFGNFWNMDLSSADKVFVFLLDKYMDKLDQKLSSELKKGSRLASYTFKIKDKKIASEKQGVYLYKY